jgi:hypothetical protein
MDNMSETYTKDYKTIKSWIVWSFAYLIILGILGAFLRGIIIFPVEGVNYKNFLHGHSHIAFLGWIFTALFSAIIYSFFPEKSSSYKWLFALLQVSVIGMLISFPIQGYGLYSIIFSTLHIFLSWIFAGMTLKNLKTQAWHVKSQLSTKFIRWALFFMIISAVGPFSLAVLMAKGLGGGTLYQLSIYFYLHFQYDGWFSFAVFGLFFKLLEQYNIKYNHIAGKNFYLLMASACIPAYALSILWAAPSNWVFILASGGAVMQLIALYYGYKMIKGLKFQLEEKINRFAYSILIFAFVAFIIKLILQMVSVFPEIAEMAFYIRNFTIGYLHLVFLGFISTFLIAWFGINGFLNLQSAGIKKGWLIFLLSFLVTEILIFMQPTLLKMGMGPLPYYEVFLFSSSILFPTSSLLFFIGLKNTHREAKTSFKLEKELVLEI